MEFLDRKLWTLEGVVFSSWAIHSSPRPSSTQRRIFDACGFNATLLFPTSPCSFDESCFLVYMYHFLFLDARCILGGYAGGRSAASIRSTTTPRPVHRTVRTQLDRTRNR